MLVSARVKALRRCRRGTASVELALVSIFLLLPLLAGAADFLTILTARAQLNTALQAMYYYAWTNSAGASNISNAGAGGVIAAINGDSVFSLTLPTTLSSGTWSGHANGLLTYSCVTPGTTPTYTAAATTAQTCASPAVLETMVTYQVDTTATLPFPLPLKLANPYSLSVIGTVQTQ